MDLLVWHLLGLNDFKVLQICTLLLIGLIGHALTEVDYCGGWLCFVCSLSMIGGVTALIGSRLSGPK